MQPFKVEMIQEEEGEEFRQLWHNYIGNGRRM